MSDEGNSKDKLLQKFSFIVDERGASLVAGSSTPSNPQIPGEEVTEWFQRLQKEAWERAEKSRCPVKIPVGSPPSFHQCSLWEGHPAPHVHVEWGD